MVPIKTIFQSKGILEKCVCGENLEMLRIYQCSCLNKENEVITYNKIYSENINEVTKCIIDLSKT